MSLKLKQKLAYGAGDLGPAITTNLLSFFLLPFLTDIAGIAPGLAGSLLAIGKLWDVVVDPVVGVLTDRTRSRWGRRRPWLLFGAIPFGLAFFALWQVPFPGNPWYYGIALVLFTTFFTVVNLPYTALTPELTQDYNERTSLTNFRFAFSISGSLVSGVLHPLIVGQFPGNLALGYSVSMGLWTVLAVLPLFWCFWGVEERFSSERSEMPLGTQVRVALSNRPYLFVIGIYLCSWLAVQLTATIIPYYITYWMRLPNTWIAGIILAVQGTSLVMLFVWSAVSNKIGKKNVYLIGMSLWIVAQVGLLVLQPGQTILMVILAILAGMGVSTAYLIPWSMIPDVIELDELETGERREGIFYAFMVLLQKISIALGLFLVGQALQATHFISATVQVPQPVQPESALLALRLILGPVPLVLVVLGMVLCWFYPITRASHQLVLDQLAQRRAA